MASMTASLSRSRRHNRTRFLTSDCLGKWGSLTACLSSNLYFEMCKEFFVFHKSQRRTSLKPQFLLSFFPCFHRLTSCSFPRRCRGGVRLARPRALHLPRVCARLQRVPGGLHRPDARAPPQPRPLRLPVVTRPSSTGVAAFVGAPGAGLRRLHRRLVVRHYHARPHHVAVQHVVQHSARHDCADSTVPRRYVVRSSCSGFSQLIPLPRASWHSPASSKVPPGVCAPSTCVKHALSPLYRRDLFLPELAYWWWASGFRLYG